MTKSRDRPPETFDGEVTLHTGPETPRVRPAAGGSCQVSRAIQNLRSGLCRSVATPYCGAWPYVLELINSGDLPKELVNVFQRCFVVGMDVCACRI